MGYNHPTEIKRPRVHWSECQMDSSLAVNEVTWGFDSLPANHL